MLLWAMIYWENPNIVLEFFNGIKASSKKAFYGLFVKCTVMVLLKRV